MNVWSERQDRIVHLVLLWGMLLSVIVMAIGICMYIASPDHPGIDIALGSLPSQLAALNPIAVLDLGIIMMILTPFCRVITTAIIFASEHELKFVGVAVLVMIIIITTILIG